MKIAICLSGHYRTHDSVFDNWYNKLYSKYDCDVFLHTWNVNGTRIEYKDDIDVVEDMTLLNETAYQIKYRFGFAAVIVEDYKQLHQKFLTNSIRARNLRNNSPSHKNRRVTHLYSMWYKALKCFETMDLYAKQKNIKYDFVIKSRPDLLVYDTTISTTYASEHLPPINNIEELSNDQITIPWYNEAKEPHDYFAIGNMSLMKKYNNLYNHMDYLLDTITLEDFLNPHALLYNYMELFKIPVAQVRNFISIKR